MKFIVKSLIVIFLIFFFMCGHCVVKKTADFEPHKVAANNVLELLFSKGIIEKENNEYVTGYYPNALLVEEIGLAYDVSSGRYFVDVVNSNFKVYGETRKYTPGYAFEYKNKELIPKGSYTDRYYLFDNEAFYDLNLQEIVIIFTIEKNYDEPITLQSKL